MSAPVEKAVIPDSVPSARPPGLKDRLFQKWLSYANKPGAIWVLFLVCFVQSALFPAPSLLVFLTFSLGAVKKTFRFAVVSAIGSILGGSVAYFIGFTAWGTMKSLFIPHLFSEAVLLKVETIYQGNIYLALLATSFMPISYQVCSVAAGILNVPYTTFLLASIIARAVRFLFLATLVHFFGEQARRFIQMNLSWLWWVLLAVLALITATTFVLRKLT